MLQCYYAGWIVNANNNLSIQHIYVVMQVTKICVFITDKDNPAKLSRVYNYNVTICQPRTMLMAVFPFLFAIY